MNIEPKQQADPKRVAVIKGDIAYLPTWNTKQGIVLAVIVDLDYAWLDGYLWHITTQGYVKAMIDGKSVPLHHVVAGKPPEGLVTDHINRNKLDNRVANLRHITQSANVRNSSVRRDSKSGVKGVTQDAYYKDWIAAIYVNGSRLHLGRFKKLDDAIKARKQAEIKYL
jgi:hypothetical protein